MTRIAYAVHKYLGLSETFIYEPLRQIKAFEVFVLTLAKENLDKFPYHNIFSISDLPPAEQFLENLSNYFGRFNYYKKIIKEFELKLIHAHFGWEGIFMLPLKKKLKLPLITSLYGSDINRYAKSFIYRRQLKKLFSQGDFFLAACEDLRQKAIALGCPADKIRVLQCGIDLDQFKPAAAPKKTEGTIKILMCGRLVEYKGFSLTIKAFAECCKRNQHISLEIIGAGPLKNELIQLIKSLHLEKSITLSGGKGQAEVAQAMRQADIFVMPYSIGKHGECEASPLVLKEALASGLPVISTSIGGVPEVIMSGTNGILIKPNNLTALIQNLDYLINNPELRHEFGVNGRKMVEARFDVRVQAQQLEKIYQDHITLNHPSYST